MPKTLSPKTLEGFSTANWMLMGPPSDMPMRKNFSEFELSATDDMSLILSSIDATLDIGSESPCPLLSKFVDTFHRYWSIGFYVQRSRYR